MRIDILMVLMDPTVYKILLTRIFFYVFGNRKRKQNLTFNLKHKKYVLNILGHILPNCKTAQNNNNNNNYNNHNHNRSSRSFIIVYIFRPIRSYARGQLWLGESHNQLYHVQYPQLHISRPCPVLVQQLPQI